MATDVWLTVLFYHAKAKKAHVSSKVDLTLFCEKIWRRLIQFKISWHFLEMCTSILGQDKIIIYFGHQKCARFAQSYNFSNTIWILHAYKDIKQILTALFTITYSFSFSSSWIKYNFVCAKDIQMCFNFSWVFPKTFSIYFYRIWIGVDFSWCLIALGISNYLLFF